MLITTVLKPKSDIMKKRDNKYRKIEERIKELEKINKKLLSESIETYNVAVINMDKIKEIKREIRRCKYDK